MKLRRTSWLVFAGLMVLAWGNVAQPGQPPPTSATGAERAKQQVKPSEPCCAVTAIDAKTGISTHPEALEGRPSSDQPSQVSSELGGQAEARKVFAEDRGRQLDGGSGRGAGADVTYKVRIEGHTDAKGADAYNHKLSERRANSVKDWLVKNEGLKSV